MAKLSNIINDFIARQLSVRFLWCLTLSVGIFSFINTHPIRPNDFWWHLALGREILATGQIPTVDIYSYTMTGQPYAGYQMFWLADIGLFLLYRLGGAPLIIFANSLLITSAYILILIMCHRASKGWGTSALALFFAAALGIHNWNVRPQSLSFPIGALFIYTIHNFRQDTKGLKWLIFPAGMLLWVNSHGSFVIGFVLLFIWLADEFLRWLADRRQGEHQQATRTLMTPAALLILTGLASLLNPRGLGVFAYVLNLSNASVIQNLVPEWAPPVFNTQIGMIFYLGLLFSAAVMALSPHRPNFFELATFLVFALLSMRTTRGIVWFGLAMAPILASHLSALAGRNRDESDIVKERPISPRINAGFMVILMGIAILSLPWFKNLLPFPALKSGLLSSETPVKATAFLLNERPSGNLFNEMGFGSYLIWATQPEYRVFADPRIELYPSEVWKDYLWISNAMPGWEDKLNAYGVRTLLLSPKEQAALIAAADSSGRWVRIYSDDAAVIFTKQD